MRLNVGTLAEFTVAFEARRFVRVIRLRFRAQPLGTGLGDTRFSSPGGRFMLLYLGRDVATSVAETIVRDRFEGKAPRQLTAAEVTDWAAVEVSSTRALNLLDIRKTGCVALGVSTDVKGAKGQDEARRFSDAVYDQTGVDGILYNSRLTGDECVAVYDRALVKLAAATVVDLVRLPELIPALRSLRIELIV